MPEEDRVDLLSTIVDESERLNRFIANLLDMTRLESGSDGAQTMHCTIVGDIAGSALQRSAKILAHHKTEMTDRRPDLPMVRVDPVLLRAGSVQPARQCGKIRAGRTRPSASKAGANADNVVYPGRCDEGQGHSARRSGTGLRHFLPGAQR